MNLVLWKTVDTDYDQDLVVVVVADHKMLLFQSFVVSPDIDSSGRKELWDASSPHLDASGRVDAVDVGGLGRGSVFRVKSGGTWRFGILSIWWPDVINAGTRGG